MDTTEEAQIPPALQHFKDDLFVETGRYMAWVEEDKASDKLNVNKHEDAEAVKKLYRDRHPFCKPLVERIADRREVVIRFYDMDAQKQVVRVNGLPSVRNYRRMLFPKVASLDDKTVCHTVSKHIRSWAPGSRRRSVSLSWTRLTASRP